MIKEYVAYIKDNPEGYWFKSKLYGWGWTPATREGWLVTFVYGVLVIGIALRIPKDMSITDGAIPFLLPLVFLTALFFYIAYRKGERPHWMWGVPSRYKRE